MGINLAKYNLPSRIKLRAISENHIGIEKLIKSRIIQKDAIKIVEISNQIKKNDSNITVSLICTTNICSKSLLLLKDENIPIITEEL